VLKAVVTLPGMSRRVFLRSLAGSLGVFTVACSRSPKDRANELTAPTIIQQPDQQLVNIGARATFSVIVEGSLPLTYTWRLNNVDIPYSNSSTFATEELGVNDHASFYSVVIANEAGEVVSDNAHVFINLEAITVDSVAITADNGIFTI
jgi:hypothetical protein